MFSRLSLFVVPLASVTLISVLPASASDASSAFNLPAPERVADTSSAERLVDAAAVPMGDTVGEVNLQAVDENIGGYGFFKGDNEFTLTGAGAASDDFDVNAFGFAAQYGYFFEDNIEVGARLNGALSSGESSYQLGIGAAIDYHFRLMNGRLNPFVGAVLGYNFGDDVNDSFAAGPEVGVKYFVNETTFLFGSASYQWSFRDGGDSDVASDEGQFVYAVGVGFKF
ncbi:MAG TPA: hypothetical protein VGN72_23850 [Tepidisphaeraceae bacterium]|jgi:outer membrane protein W|nr:hypothetical protein [Tepidisphaeraceae bacterium]